MKKEWEKLLPSERMGIIGAGVCILVYILDLCTGILTFILNN
jgi:hypothetical protein